jgi:spermidine synthase
LEKLSEERLWNGFRLIATRNSVYGNLAVVQEEGSRSVYENGVVLFHVPDPAAAEEAVHYALLEHPAPRRLLLIGGGLNGSIAQALQHPSLEQVDYAELDPAILDVARKYFPDEWAAAKNNPRVRVHTNDGRLFLKSADCEFDVIIVNLPDPQTAELNRFYTVEFFREAARKLTPTGILSFHVTAAEDYVSPELAEFLRSIATSLSAVFPEVRAIPGGTFHFFAARRPGVLAGGAEELLARLRERHLNTSYVREYYLPFRMSRDRMAELESQIRPGPDAAINHDFAPIAYYFDAALWSSRFHQGYARLFRTMAEVSFRGLALTAGLVLAVIAAAGRLLKGRERRCRATAAACTISMGFLSIGLEMLLLLAFQAIYGYVYQQLAIVIAVFMAGMALGSWLALRSRTVRRMRSLACLQALGAAAPAALYGVFAGAAHVSSPAGLFVAGQFVFPALAGVSGLLGGYEFPLACRVYSGQSTTPPPLYALDLAGSCAGAYLFSAYLIPVFGFLKTALLMAIVGLGPAAMAMTQTSKPDPAG